MILNWIAKKNQNSSIVTWVSKQMNVTTWGMENEDQRIISTQASGSLHRVHQIFSWRDASLHLYQGRSSRVASNTVAA